MTLDQMNDVDFAEVMQDRFEAGWDACFDDDQDMSLTPEEIFERDHPEEDGDE